MKKPKNAKAASQPATGKKRGRPPGTGKQKAAKAPKQSKAEKSAAKTEQKQAAATAAVGSPAADPKLRRLFLSFINGTDGSPSIPALKEKVSKANSAYRAALKMAKKDGFELFMFDTAALVSTAEGEEKFKHRMGRELLAAQFVGSTIGLQLDMFNAPDRTPAVDRAYSEGQKASMENKAAIPPYDPSTPQHQAYMKGFHDHQAALLKDGMKQKQPTEAAPATRQRKPKAGKVEVPPTAPEPQPSDKVVPITRAAIIAQQQRGEMIGDVDADEDGEGGAGPAFAEDDAAAGGFSRRN